MVAECWRLWRLKSSGERPSSPVQGCQGPQGLSAWVCWSPWPQLSCPWGLPVLGALCSPRWVYSDAGQWLCRCQSHVWPWASNSPHVCVCWGSAVGICTPCSRSHGKLLPETSGHGAFPAPHFWSWLSEVSAWSCRLTVYLDTCSIRLTLRTSCRKIFRSLLVRKQAWTYSHQTENKTQKPTKQVKSETHSCISISNQTNRTRSVKF